MPSGRSSTKISFVAYGRTVAARWRDSLGPRLLTACTDRSGAIVIMAAVCLPVLLLTIGFAIDYGYASYLNQRLAKATDAAVLAAVSQTSATVMGGYGNTAGLQLAGVNLFNANISSLALSNVSFSLNVTTDSGGNVTALGAYSYTRPTFFARIPGMPATIPLSGTMASTAHPTVYQNYYLVVDVSQSMAIAATQADMQALYNRVVANGNSSNGDTGCVFACHQKAASTANANVAQPYTNEDLAHNLSKYWGPPITLRLDTAVTAVQNIISNAQTIAGITKNIGIAIYTIATDASDGSNLDVISEISSNYPNLATLAATIKMEDGYTFNAFNNRTGTGSSDFASQLTALQAKLPTNGSGASSIAPQNFVFLVTDGFGDTPNSSVNCAGANNCFPVFDASKCTSLKANATVAVIYTTYLPIYKNNDQSQGLEPLFNSAVGGSQRRDLQVLPALQNCATSSDYFFQADDGPALIAAMQALFLKTQPVTARLTQ